MTNHKPPLKKALKIIGKILLGFFAFILLYIILAYSISIITVEREPNTKEEVTIYIMTNGVHTDIVVPTRNEFMDWSKMVKYENTISKDTTYQYLAMGWGDKGFYLETPNWSDLRASTALKAASGLSNTAIHATYFSNIKENESCKKIIISKEQYVRLVDYMKNSFKKDEKGQFIHIKTDQNYGKRDAFYEGTGSYSLLHTCNTWANNALKVSGQKCCFWTPIDSAIFSKYETN